jgi:hypothetical protein
MHQSRTKTTLDMAQENYTLKLTTTQNAADAFSVILNVRGWWSGLHGEEFEGRSEKLNDEFTFRAGKGAHYSKQKLVELVANKRIAWLVTESHLSFLEETAEWTGSRLVFDISSKGDHTEVVFTHEGLTPEVECYDMCAPTWTLYLQNKLLPLVGDRLGANQRV